VNTSFGKAGLRACIPHVRFHDLRHAFASWLVMRQMDMRTVLELLGHRDIRMTMRYSHLAPDHVRHAVQVLDRPAEVGNEEIPDGHYLDTGGVQNKNQGAAGKA
jgi:integrase